MVGLKGFSVFALRTASAAPFRMSSCAFCGCRQQARLRLSARFTGTVTAPGNCLWVSAQAASSPVTMISGTPKCPA